MNKKELKKELKRLKNRLKNEKDIRKYFEDKKNESYSLYLSEESAKKKLEDRLCSISKANKNGMLNDFSDFFYDNSSRMNVFSEVQNICIKAVGIDREVTDRAEHYAWFFAYIHGLLKKEASREFQEIEEQFAKEFQV
jgi:hypothetical protein